MRYVKLYESMKCGTLAAKGGTSLALWPLFLLEASWEGEVNMHPGLLATKWKFPEDVVLEAIRYWEAPDPGSSSPAFEGRRIIRLHEHRDWGWRIVNWEVYRDAEGPEAKRLRDRDSKRRQRERDKTLTVRTNVSGNGKCPEDSPLQITEDLKKEKKKNSSSSKKKKRSTVAPEEWQPSAELLEELATAHPSLDVKVQLRRCRQYEFARAYSDWDRVFRNWMDKAEDFPRGKAPDDPFEGAI